MAYTLGWCRLFIPFQPFTDKVANNTCQYRDNECNNSFHGVSPPLYRKGSRLLYIITSYKVVQSVLLFKTRQITVTVLADFIFSVSIKVHHIQQIPETTSPFYVESTPGTCPTLAPVLCSYAPAAV